MCKCSYCVRSSLWVSWHLVQTVETMFVWCAVQNGLLVIIWRHSSYGEAGWASIHPRISAQSLCLECLSVVDSIMILSYFLYPEHLRNHFILRSKDHFVRTNYTPFFINPCFPIIPYSNADIFYPASFFFRLDQYREEKQAWEPSAALDKESIVQLLKDQSWAFLLNS